jgi:hypothetical protein
MEKLSWLNLQKLEKLIESPNLQRYSCLQIHALFCKSAFRIKISLCFSRAIVLTKPLQAHSHFSFGMLTYELISSYKTYRERENKIII